MDSSRPRIQTSQPSSPTVTPGGIHVAIQSVALQLGSQGQPLDVGRTKRLVTPALLAALWARDKGCTYPSCGRPPQWADAHHVTHWADGGTTCLLNLALLCGYHPPPRSAGRYPHLGPPTRPHRHHHRTQPHLADLSPSGATSVVLTHSERAQHAVDGVGQAIARRQG